jgi:pimeloyl-ACP methyl ester carboxylesterase
MLRAEVRDTGALLGTALSEVSEIVHDVHKAVSGRLFDALGGSVRPIRLFHDGVAALAYTSTTLGVRIVPAAVGLATAELRAPSTRSVHSTPRGHFLLNVLNGFWGDRLANERASLATELTIRTHEGQLRRLPENLLHDVAETATEKVIVFLHGLCESDQYWTFGASKNYQDPRVTYGSLLREEQGWTPLYVSYNSGLHISANGRELAERLEQLAREWPVPIEQIALVGHSMGGLVAGSAAQQAAEAGYAWVPALRHVVGLGAPHHGAPLERFVNAGTHTLARLPETRPFAQWLNRRSVGIKDLRYGAVLQSDWWDVDPDERLVDRRGPASMLPGVTYSVASATLSRREEGLFAHDLLVQHASAHGIHPTRRIPFEQDRMLHVGRRTHFHLLGDPLVYAQLRTWLAD